MSPHLHLIRSDATAVPARQPAPADYLREDTHPPAGWRVLYAIDPVTRERFASVWCEKSEDVAPFAALLEHMIRRRLVDLARRNVDVGSF